MRCYWVLWFLGFGGWIIFIKSLVRIFYLVLVEILKEMENFVNFIIIIFNYRFVGLISWYLKVYNNIYEIIL